MTPIEERVRHALENIENAYSSPWTGLMALYRSDREAFFLLACDAVSGDADLPLRTLSDLAQKVRAVVRATYQIEPETSDREATLRSRTGQVLVLPSELVQEIKRFLMEVDGKGVAGVPGKDFVGSLSSEAELRFKLGEGNTWERDQQRLQARRSAQPLVLRVDPRDLKSLESQPAYVRYGLLQCATKTVLAPTAIYRDLKRGGDSPERLRQGWLICGKPRRAFDNHGNPIDPPQNMVYMVYADQDGFVFDWDWVQENPGEPGHPINPELRSGDLIVNPPDAVLEVPGNLTPGAFDASKACYSRKGDCIFCYLSDELAYAERINPDLTIFREFGNDKVAGFKIKNVQRIVQQDKGVILSLVPDLLVSVAGILLATFKLNKDAKVEVYNVIIEAFWCSPHQPRQVKLPQPESQVPELATC